MKLLRKRYPNVLISSHSFANAVFVEGREDIKHTKLNILQKNLMLFPMYEGYWSLLVVNLKERRVYLYDSLKQHQQINRLLRQVFNLIEKYLNQYEQKPLDQTVWRDFYYKPSTCPEFNREDTAVFICKQADSAVTGKPDRLDPSSSQDYKQDIIVSLIQSSQI